MSFRPPDLRHLPLPIVREDPRWVVVNKPSGLLSVPAKDPSITDNVRARVAKLYPHARGPLTVHRLDMETSGALLLALDPEAHRDLSLQFQERTVSKRYIAVVEGVVTSDEGLIELPLRLDIDRRPFQIVDHQLGKYARTKWQVLQREQDCTRVLLIPQTGRTHQLRVHCAHPEGLGHPILGDRLYGNPRTANRLMLHARSLRFAHPSTGSLLGVESHEPF
ncbi:MAG: RluA family pseudouridine synthase [Myxococcales bacterium]|nr:RluA family pseudouridine synthase [Myxococcales bacterium]